MKAKFLRLSGLVLALALVVTACGGQEAKKPEASTPAASDSPSVAAEPTKPLEVMKTSMATGGKGTLVYLPTLLSEYMDLFKAEGLDVDSQDLKGGSQAAQALVSGQVDFATMALDHVIKSQAQGVDVVAVAIFTRYPGVALVVDSKYKDNIKSVADLKGKLVGVTSPGSGTHAALLAMLAKAGVAADQVEVVGVGSATMAQAIESGKVVAAVNADPYITQMVQSGKGYVLSDLRTEADTVTLYGSAYPFITLATRKDVLEKNPELVKRMVRAVVKANNFIAANDAATIASKVPAEYKGDETLYVASLDKNRPIFAPGALADERSLSTVIATMKSQKAIPENAAVTPASVFDSSMARSSR